MTIKNKINEEKYPGVRKCYDFIVEGLDMFFQQEVRE